MSYPKIIQGGMGAGVSSWRLARAVSMEGQLGVVSGTALATLFVRVLQLGDVGGHVRRAVDAFPAREVAERIYQRYHVPGGVSEGQPFKRHAMYTLNASQDLLELTVFASFAEVFLAKEGHDGVVGMNLLEKITLPNLPSLYGAMLADVDYILMGAGIPMEIPGALDALAEHKSASLRIHVAGALKGEDTHFTFDPAKVFPTLTAPLKRPLFLAIIASNVLATALKKRATGRIDGFVVEGPSAGGHNAPPRGSAPLNERGEPVYGPKDDVNIEELKTLGLPFWLAGSYGSPERLKEALDRGAAGIQAGTVFALCEESGLESSLREAMLAGIIRGDLDVYTDPLASPTGFPFKVARLEGTLADDAVYDERPRRCDLGYLRAAYRKEDGSVDFRCPGEPLEQFVAKGGCEEEAQGRKCLCNALTGVVGLAQHQPGGYVEKALVTIGDDVKLMTRFMHDGNSTLHARDVIREMLQACGTN